ncbi:putative intracellular septation protein [Saliniradius amylolyticus]|uniref:Inner membrane-spanning protein YciB n=1 Tax=Saliniradius amylolyticus TaxID=2183582 RepID=A0A2S2E238_9ALTE|nr:septation protein A [Saliniradius amylolyticus]AWL11715.1 putative intracellular septation protein [Saliniradius amylolyticus]
MTALFEFLPLIVFFVVYKIEGIFWATGALMAMMVLQILVTFAKTKSVPKKQWLFLAIILVFGGLTIGLRDETFIMWKPTIVYVVFFAGLMISQWMKKPAIKGLMGGAIAMPERIWNRLNTSWALFFLLSAMVNLYVAYQFSEEVWVNFKVWGMTGATLLFCVASILAVQKHVTEVDTPAKEND